MPLPDLFRRGHRQLRVLLPSVCGPFLQSHTALELPSGSSSRPSWHHPDLCSASNFPYPDCFPQRPLGLPHQLQNRYGYGERHFIYESTSYAKKIVEKPKYFSQESSPLGDTETGLDFDSDIPKEGWSVRRAPTEEFVLMAKLKTARLKCERQRARVDKLLARVSPAGNPADVEILTPEDKHMLRRVALRTKNYVPVGRRGLYAGTFENMHLHWKHHQTVQVEFSGYPKEQVQGELATRLVRESGGILLDVHQGKTVLLYRGKNYARPKMLKPPTLLDRRRALQWSLANQSMKDLEMRIEALEAQLADVRRRKAEALEQTKPRLRSQLRVSGEGAGAETSPKSSAGLALKGDAGAE
eukprot:jgi/Mesen1/10120/ME000075S09624